ncbi:MAG: DUF885 domain-containing protein [Roseivirga sp.]|nr:DUF885 domain-containing protein [Roseivirga sp.]
MKPRFACLVILLLSVTLNSKAQNLSEDYIEAWKNFYPSRALSSGMHPSIFSYEDRSDGNIKDWITYNMITLIKLSDRNGYTSKNPIDARLLKVQVQSEIDTWQKQMLHTNSLSLYASLISNAISTVLEADFLSVPEKTRLVVSRMEAVRKLSKQARSNLDVLDRADAERAIRRLKNIENFYKKELELTLKEKGISHTQTDFDSQVENTTRDIGALIYHVENTLLPKAVKSLDVLGRKEYARQLSLYTDSKLSPEGLARMALKEIETVRALIGSVSESYLSTTYPGKPIPKDYEALTRSALGDMEKDAPINAADYLEFWQTLSEQAVSFIEEHNIATLPKNQTLRIMTAPESAGAAARIGWVASAPPFAPNPMTTLYLPSIPETLPKQEQIDFWASFNKPFNRMIVIHELFPGHYMQMKISRESPHPIRLLFPYGIYTEGWATFTERVLLDAGWEKENPLTLLAHLRKRLENANRAYTSVQVHTQGWTQQQVMEFSTKTSLVAPQFAKSLWGRIMRSPMQLTSYFLGGAQFTELLASEKARLGTKFDLTLFMDTIMKAGPIPIDEFHRIFQQTISK